MEIQNFLKSKQAKFLWGLIFVFILILLAKSGYSFGQWLHGAIN